MQAFPNVTVRNGCVPGTPSSYMVMCLDMSVDPDVVGEGRSRVWIGGEARQDGEGREGEGSENLRAWT